MRERTRQFPTKTEAQLFGDRIREKLRAAEGLELDVTFREYGERWLQLTSVAIRHGTFHVYEYAMRQHLVPTFGHLTLRSITPRMIRDMIGTLRGKLGKGTVSNVRGTLHSCLEAAVEDRILASNPARFRSKSKLMSLRTTASDHRGKVKALTEEQVRRFLAAAPHVAPNQHLLFRTMILTGLRPGEAIGLQRDDLDFEGGRIRLARAVTSFGRVEACKTDAEGQFHHVDMPDGLAAALKAWSPQQSPWLFPGRDPLRPVTHKGVQQAFTRVLGAAALPLHFTPHCLRHTYATQQLVAGESVYYVSRMLRHSDIRITVTRYGSWLPAGNRAAARRLEERLSAVAKMSPPAHQKTTIPPNLDVPDGRKVH